MHVCVHCCLETGQGEHGVGSPGQTAPSLPRLPVRVGGGLSLKPESPYTPPQPPPASEEDPELYRPERESHGPSLLLGRGWSQIQRTWAFFLGCRQQCLLAQAPAMGARLGGSSLT